MKRKLMTIAIATIAMMTTSAFADNAKQQNCKKGQVECCQGNGGQQCKPGMPNPFEGIQLTDAQKDKLKALQPCKKPETPAERDSLRKVEKRNYLNNVKAILTHEQYVQFLENSVVNAPEQKPAPKGMKPKSSKNRPDEGPVAK